MTAAVETAVNVEKVRKRIKKRIKQRETTDDPVDHRDAIDGHEGTQKESRNNLGYESGEREVKGRFIILCYKACICGTIFRFGDLA